MKSLRGKKVILREKRFSDVENDYAWGIDTELMNLDAAQCYSITFAEYSALYCEELACQNGRQHRYAIEAMDGRHIGNCTYYNIDHTRKEAELGIMIGDREYWGKGYGSDVVMTLADHMFHDVELEKIRIRTLDWNIRAQRCFRKCGFVPCGRVSKRGYEFVKMELCRGWLMPASASQDSHIQSGSGVYHVPGDQ